jgi:ABC-type antimicrobial peptide transport system permease subunit
LSFQIRQRDLALRMALGAGPASLRRLLIAEVIRLSAVTGAIAIPALWITCLQATDLALSSMHWMLCFSGAWMVQLGVVLACALLAQRKLLRPDISRILRASD